MGFLLIATSILLFFVKNFEDVLSQNINFVLIVEGRSYGLADQFTTHFKQVEDDYKQ